MALHGNHKHGGVGLEQDTVGDAWIEQTRKDARFLVGDSNELDALVNDEL